MITVYERSYVFDTHHCTCFNYNHLNQETFDDFVKEIKERLKITIENSESFAYSFEYVALDDIINCTDPIAKTIIFNACFKRCSIINCDFSEVTFEGAVFDFCEIKHCIFSGNSRENLIDMKLCRLIANKFNNQKLSGNINSCILANNEFNNTDLTFVDISHCDLGNNNIDKKSGLYYPTACPKEGEFIGWKKACERTLVTYHGVKYPRFIKTYIVKLLIPADAKRSSAFSNKCRCSKAKVLEIQNFSGSKADIDEVFSYGININDDRLAYKTGGWVYPDSFDENRFNECSNGIHFFMNREDAVRY